MAELQIQNLMFQRGDFCLLLDQLQISPGEKVAIMGENGSGKSTLLHLLAGLLNPQGGKINYGHRPLHQIPFSERAHIFSLLPQFTDMTFPFSVYEVVLFGRFPHSTGKDYSKEDHLLTEEKIAWLDLGKLCGRKFGQLSGGEKRRVMLARVLNQQAPIIYLDEPNASLDIRHTLDIFELLTARDETVIAPVHDVNLACRFFDRFLFLKRGNLLADVLKDEITPELLEETYDVQVATGTSAFTFQQ